MADEPEGPERMNLITEALALVQHRTNAAWLARLHDRQVWDDLLHGAETSVWVDKGYVSAAREAACAEPIKVWGVMRKASKGRPVYLLDVQINHIVAMVRAKVEHPFHAIKRQFGHVKTRYRHLAKNRAQMFTQFAPGNLFLVRQKLIAWGQVSPNWAKGRKYDPEPSKSANFARKWCPRNVQMAMSEKLKALIRRS